MATYEQMFKKLKSELALKAEIHFKLDSEVSKTGFKDAVEMENYLKTQEDWHTASKNYTNFLAQIADKEINPNDMAVLN
jgi:hypothetical protein